MSIAFKHLKLYLILAGLSLIVLSTVIFLSLTVCCLRGSSCTAATTEGFFGVLRNSAITFLLPCSSNFFFTLGGGP